MILANNKFIQYFHIFIVIQSIHCRNEELIEYASPPMCKNDEYFEVESFACVGCEATRNLEPSPDRLSCVCRNDTKIIGFENGHPICEPCGPDENPTTDGMDCIVCPKRGINSSCTCSPSEIKLERDMNGTLLYSVQCLPCPENSYPSPNGLECLPCRDNAMKSHVNCPCPVVSHLRIQKYCVHKAGLTDWPDLRSTYLIKYETQNIDSYYLRTELQLAVYLCKNGDRAACEHLSNMCALTLYTNSMACKMFSDKDASPLWLYYGEGEAPTVLNRRKISQRYSLDKDSTTSKLNFTVAMFTLNGQFQSIAMPNIFCDFLRNVRFGMNHSKRCKVAVKRLTEMKMDFIVPYLQYSKGNSMFLYALPVLIRNIHKDQNDASQWQLVRKFFLVDTITGVRALPNPLSTIFKKDSVPSVIRYMKSLHVLVKVQNKEERGKIFPPLLVAEYGELSKEHVHRNIEVTIDYKVTYILADNDMDNAIEVSTGVLSGFAVAFSAIKAWSYCKRNSNGIPDASTVLWFLVNCCGALGNVLVLVSLSASVYTFVFYKGQTVLHVLLPSEATDNNLRVFAIVAFSLKIVEIVALVYQHRNICLFFIDWEQPRSIQSRPNYDSPNKSLKKLYANRFPFEKHSPLETSSEIIAARRHKTPAKSNEINIPNRRSKFSTPNKGNDGNFMDQSSETSFSVGEMGEMGDMGDMGQHSGQQKIPVSIWRTYFVANEWFKIQTKRKVNMLVQGIATLFILEVVGIKLWASPDLELTVAAQELSAQTKKSFTLRFAVGALVYVFVYCVQWLTSITLYERCIKNCIQEFVDLCSIANISVFILALDHYGYYIHGRSVHGFADTDLATLIDDLKREEENVCAHRGLLPGRTEQTFIISVSTTFRAFYNKVISPRKLIENRFSKRDASDTSNLEKNVHVQYPKMKNFLTGFLDHCFKDMDYVTKEKQFLEKLFDIEFTDAKEKSIFYIDNNHSFDRVMFHGNEWTLATFEVTLFVFMEAILEDYILATITTVFVSQLLVIVRRFNAKKNLASKTLLDERFFI